MRIKLNYPAKILLILLICIECNTVTQGQDNTKSKVIELPQECKLVLDETIDINDSLSIKIINGIRDIITRVQSLVPLDSIVIELAISNSNVLPFLGLGGRTNMDDSGIWIEYYYEPKNPNFRIESLIT